MNTNKISWKIINDTEKTRRTISMLEYNLIRLEVAKNKKGWLNLTFSKDGTRADSVVDCFHNMDELFTEYLDKSIEKTKKELNELKESINFEGEGCNPKYLSDYRADLLRKIAQD